VYFERRDIYEATLVHRYVYMTALYSQKISRKIFYFLYAKNEKKNRKNKNFGITENLVALYTYWARLFFIRTLKMLSSEMDPAEIRFKQKAFIKKRGLEIIKCQALM
jgi:hypothetical protein